MDCYGTLSLWRGELMVPKAMGVGKLNLKKNQKNKEAKKQENGRNLLSLSFFGKKVLEIDFYPDFSSSLCSWDTTSNRTKPT